MKSNFVTPKEYAEEAIRLAKEVKAVGTIP